MRDAARTEALMTDTLTLLGFAVPIRCLATKKVPDVPARVAL
jgi:hypothetical protein